MVATVMLRVVDTSLTLADDATQADTVTEGAVSSQDVVALRATLAIDADAASMVVGCYDPHGEDCGVWA